MMQKEIFFCQLPLLGYYWHMSRSRKQKLLIYVAFAIVYMIMTSVARINAPIPAPASVPENPTTNSPTASTTSATSSGTGSDSQPHGPDEFLVTRIVDGDTIQVSENGLPDGPKKTVRYIGMDTPETVSPGKPVECFGKEASAKNGALVLGKFIRLEKDISDTDKYGRWLRYAYLSTAAATGTVASKDEIFINMTLVREGYATVSTYPPDIRHRDEFRAAELAARNEKAGLWGAVCN